MKGLIILIVLAGLGFGGFRGYEYYKEQKEQKKQAEILKKAIADAPEKLKTLLDTIELKRLGSNMYRLPAEAAKRYKAEAYKNRFSVSVEEREKIEAEAFRIEHEKRSEIFKIRIANINAFIDKYNEIMREIRQPELSAEVIRELRGLTLYAQTDACTVVKLKGFNRDLVETKDFAAMSMALASEVPLQLKEQFAASFFGKDSILWRQAVVDLKKSEYNNRIKYDYIIVSRYNVAASELAKRIFDLNKHFFSWEYDYISSKNSNGIQKNKLEKFKQEQELFSKLLMESNERIDVDLYDENCFKSMVRWRLLCGSWKIPFEQQVPDRGSKNMTYAEIMGEKDKTLQEIVELKKYPIPNYQFMEQVCLFPERETDLRRAFASLKARYANCRATRYSNDLVQMRNVRDFFKEYNALAVAAKIRFFHEDEIESFIKANQKRIADGLKIDGYYIAEKYGVFSQIDIFMQKPADNPTAE